MLKVSTFCSGIGSPEVALKNLGVEHEVVLTAEIDKYARQTYLANHYTKKMVNDMTEPDYIGEEYYSDINVSGLPCQSFSLAGKRLGELDPRGLLFFDFLRYVKNQTPKYFIIENVKGLLSDNNGETFRNWIQLLGQSENGNTFMFPHEDSLMYNLHWQVLNTKDYGLPQNRERVFLIGIRNDLPNDFNFPKTIPLKLRLKDILEDIVDEKYYLSEKAIKTVYAKEGVYTGINEDPVRCLTTRYSASISGTFLKVSSATKSGYEIATEGNQRIAGWFENENVIGAYRDDAKRSSVSEHIYQKENSVCNTIQCAHVPKVIQGGEWRVASAEFKIGAMRGRNPENPSDRTPGAPTQQMLEINENGTSNCLTSVQKDNVVVEYSNPKVKHILSGGKWDKMHEQSRRVFDINGIAPTIHTMGGGNQEIKVMNPLKDKTNFGWHFEQNVFSEDSICRALKSSEGSGNKPKIIKDYRIRKLTPLECFRLQGFSDEFLQNAIDSGVSNSQLYKQAGNSISVPVIQAILKNLLT